MLWTFCWKEPGEWTVHERKLKFLHFEFWRSGSRRQLFTSSQTYLMTSQFTCEKFCLVPVRRFPTPSRSIRFGDVSEANGRETASHFRMDHVTRNALVARKNEAQGLSNEKLLTGYTYIYVAETKFGTHKEFIVPYI